MSSQNIDIFGETLRIIDAGRYSIQVGGQTVERALKLSKGQMTQAIALSPEQVNTLIEHPPYNGSFILGGRCGFSVMNADAFTPAVRLSSFMEEESQRYPQGPHRDPKKILVLNFANPVEPGGGVRRGAQAQEEDLCRKSTLMASLESEEATAMYAYNRSNSFFLGSDYMILSPHVEVFRDADNRLLDDSAVFSVLTAAAPISSQRTSGVSDEEIEETIFHRIMGMLQIATTYEYKILVLGAWGCGAFGNDADTVARLFYKAFKEIKCGKILTADSLFDSVIFAVLDNTTEQYNFKCFDRYFSDFHQDEDAAILRGIEDKKKENEQWLDQIRGSFIGGAVGDALGYPVEFVNYDSIVRKYGERGITRYKLSGGKALISDDTQMTLFTANGILWAETRMSTRGIAPPMQSCLATAYRDWLATQEGLQPNQSTSSWLYNIKELHERRAPGNTCLMSARALSHGLASGGKARNNSKGCGGIMRVAPVGLYFRGRFWPLDKIDQLGAEAAAITHGHPLGYIPAAALVHIVHQIVYGEFSGDGRLLEIVNDCIAAMERLFANRSETKIMTDLIRRAIELSQGDRADADAVAQLGEGWVAEETLAIALYCCLKHQDSFEQAIIAAVNHCGDSDSTGAVAGNIMGALVGYQNIPDYYKENLELHDVILEIADDICHDCQISEYGHYRDPIWEKKYIYGSYSWDEEKGFFDMPVADLTPTAEKDCDPVEMITCLRCGARTDASETYCRLCGNKLIADSADTVQVSKSQLKNWLRQCLRFKKAD